MSIIPSLSLRDFTHGSPATRLAFLLDLERALREIGFVRFRDHGIAQELLEQYYNLLKIFFVEWPETERMIFEQHWNGRQRGYGPLGCEHAAGTNEFTEFDLKCFFSTGVALRPGHPRFDEIPVNVYPNIPNFRRITDMVYEELLRIKRQIFSAISVILGMPPDYLVQISESGDNMLRGLYYPGTKNLPALARERARVIREQCEKGNIPIPEAQMEMVRQLENGTVPPGVTRSGRHTDIDMGTILPRASAKGLVAVTRSGAEVPVSGDYQEVLFQTGDTLEDMSGGYLLSAVHRVDMPTESPEEDRINGVMFCHADRGYWVDVLESMREHATKSVNPATERRKLILRLHEIGHTGIPMPER